MAFTDKERDIARQIKEQGGSREDFLDILQQVRSQQPTQASEQVNITETEEWVEVEETNTIQVWEQTIKPSIDPSVLTNERLDSIISESDEWFTGFVEETWEALWKRIENVKDINTRFKQKIKDKRAATNKALEEWGVSDFVLASMKWELNNLGSSFQLVGQTIWAWADVVWEWLENIIQDWLVEWVEDKIKSSVASVANSEAAKWIAESYKGFKERNPEAARNIEATINISEILPFSKAGKLIKKTEPKDTPKSIELEKEAEAKAEEFLKPTKVVTKQQAKQITPELLERIKSWELKTWDREFVKKQAELQLETVGKNIWDFIEQWNVKGDIRLDSLVDVLAKADNELRIDWVLLPWNEQASKFINKQVDFLWQLETKYGVNLPSSKQVELRRLYDVVFDKSVTRDKITKFQDEMQVKLADELRKELAKNNPELAKLNLDFSFYKWLDNVLWETIERTTGQNKTWLLTTLSAGQQWWVGAAIWASAWATIWGIPWAAIWATIWGAAWAKLAKVVSNPKYKLVDAKKKSELADAIANGKTSKVEKILNSIIISQNIDIEDEE